MPKYEYIVSSEGIIYRKSSKGLKEVQKRLGTKGVLEFKMNNKTTSYRKFVATALIPNPNNCDKVFSRNGNQFDTHPDNLKWVWTRENRKLTTQEAMQRTNDSYLMQYYQNGDKKALQRGINNVIENNFKKIDSELLGELYLIIQDYADRNLLFELQTDIMGTYIGLKKQQYRKKLKTVSLSLFSDKHEINTFYE